MTSTTGWTVRRSGTDNGVCIRTVVGQTYECSWTTSLAQGQIMVEGPFLARGPSTLAITGGTGSYTGARGWLELTARAGGTKYNFVFHLIL